MLRIFACLVATTTLVMIDCLLSAAPDSTHIFRTALRSKPSTAWVYAVDDKLMRWFEITTYVILEPNSYSRRVLNDQVHSTVL